MTALSNAYGAVNLSQGFPDFAADPELINLVTEYMHQGFNQYAPMPGIMELRQAIANKLFGPAREVFESIVLLRKKERSLSNGVTRNQI